MFPSLSGNDLLNRNHSSDSMEEDQFTPSLVNDLLERLEENSLPHLTPNEHQSLVVLIQTTLQVCSRMSIWKHDTDLNLISLDQRATTCTRWQRVAIPRHDAYLLQQQSSSLITEHACVEGSCLNINTTSSTIALSGHDMGFSQRVSGHASFSLSRCMP